MALSGNFETKFGGGSSGGYYIGVDWKVNSQSASSNSSNVTATVYLRTSGNGYSISSSATKDVSVTINGTKYLSTCTVGISANSKKNLFSKTVNVGHDSNGNKTCSFACALDINVTLSGTYHGKVSSSGSGTFNQIILNQPPTLSGSVTISPSGTIGENTTTLNLDWSDAKDPNGDTVQYRVYRYINGAQNGTYWQGSSSLSDNISSFGQGTTFQYKVWAYDSKGTYSGEISSAIVTKNKFTGAWFTGHSNDIAESTTQFSLTVGGASNTNGNTTFKYRFYSDDITVYNQRDVATTTETITIWKDHLGESEPTGKPYIKFSDLKNKYRGTNFNGRLHVGVRTLNAYGSQVWNGGSIGVDLRATPSAPSTVTINGGSAYKTVASASGNSYYIPNGKDTIAIQWSGGEDKIKETHQYRIYQIVDGTAKEVATVSGTTKSYNLVLPKISATQTLAIRVQTVTSYGYTNYKDSTAITLHYYNPPSVDVQKVDRTDTSAKATLTLKANTSIPNVTFTTRSYTGVSSGTLTNTTSSQTISASGLKGDSKYSWTITLKDDTGFSESVTRSIEVPSYTPLFSVREKGVGINTIPTGQAGLMVNKGAIINGGLTVDGVPIGEGGGGGGSTTWTSKIKANTWSRILFVKGSTLGSGGMLTLVGTRGNVVYNHTLCFSATHPNRIDITQLTGSRYSAIKIRGVVDTSGNCYIELYDVANQDIIVSFSKYCGGDITKYTSVTSGATVPSGYVASQETILGLTGVITSTVKAQEDMSYDTSKAPCNTSQIAIKSNNNGMGIGVDSTFNGRTGWIQVGHSDDAYSTSYGTLQLNPRGGQVNIGTNVQIVGQDIKIHSKRALVGFTNNELEINYGQDFSVRTKINGRLDIEDNPNILNLKGGSGNHCYVGFYPRSDKNSRGGYLGYGSNGTNTFTINNAFGDINLDASTQVNCRKIDASGWIQSGEYWIRSGGRIYSGYNNNYIFADHSNGNVTVSASGNTLFFGYQNTNNFNIAYCSLWDVGATSGANLKMDKAWSGSSGTEISIYNSKGKGWGFIGNTNNTFYRIYGAGGSVSARDSKYHITKADDEQSYEYVKQISAYNFRTISTTDANIDEVAKSYMNIKEFREDSGSLIRESFVYEGVVYDEIDNNLKEEEVESLRIQEVIDKNPQFKKDLYRQDLMLGAMVDELPTEVVFYDCEDGDGKAVDMYSYTTMIVSALKHTIKKVEKLEEILNSEER